MTIHEFLGVFLAGLIFGGIVFGFAGYWLASHIHSVAANIAMAATRATTIPAGVVASLNSSVPGSGTALQSAANSVGAAAVEAAAKAATAAPAQN